MHPRELRNMALVAAQVAEDKGFPATAKTFLDLAISCDVEANLPSRLGQIFQSRRPQELNTIE